MRPPRLAVVLVAHGSRDPRAGESTEALARAVAYAHPEWEVHASYLDHAGPRPLDVLAGLSFRGHAQAVLVPLLLTAAYHGRVDVPAVVTAAAEAGLRLRVDVAEVLGPVPSAGAAAGPPAVSAAAVRPSGAPAVPELTMPELLIDGLVRRLPPVAVDAVVLAAAGTRNAAARETVAAAAAALGERLGVPAVAAYASAAAPTAGAAVAALRACGARRIGVAAYFLAPGLLYDVAVGSAVAGGASTVAPPLGDAPELVGLVASRVHAVAGAADWAVAAA
jgi:sirohydrochlorin ferrochelatase